VETFVESELSEQGKTLFMEICTKQPSSAEKSIAKEDEDWSLLSGLWSL
jgi:hypothetical protein